MLIEAAQGAGIVVGVTGAAVAVVWGLNWLMQSEAVLPGGYVAETRDWKRWDAALRPKGPAKLREGTR